MNKCFLTVLVVISFFSTSWSQQIAFPGAEGYGKYTKGGRGGKVYEVTNLNDNGPGSLRAAVDASGSRTVVFWISGTIILHSSLEIRNPYITIAGQTAPGDGICLRRYPLIIRANQVIIRYLRVRLGNESGGATDAVSGRFAKHVIVDHVSASWSEDEVMSIYHCDSITVQWCIISEALYNSNHPNDKDTSVDGPHGFGGIWGSNYSSYHHNLIADNSSRNPRMASGTGYTDYRNNVIYNWGYNSCFGGEKQQVGDPIFNFTTINVVANYYKPGPATVSGKTSYRIASPSMRKEISDFGKWYIADNVVVGNKAVTSDNWDGGVQPMGGKSNLKYIKLNRPWPSIPIEQQTAQAAYDSVLDYAGAILPQRDSVDTRIVRETRGDFATYEGAAYKKHHKVANPSKKCGMIDSQTEVGGWSLLKSTPAPKDTDHDGMPDKWELKHGLNPNNPDDRNKVGKDGYTMLEEYINNIK